MPSELHPEVPVANGLVRKSTAPAFILARSLDIAMGGYEDDRDFKIGLCEVPLEIETPRPRRTSRTRQSGFPVLSLLELPR